MSPKINYDPESEVLSVRLSPEKSVDSDIQENVVIDYGQDGRVVRMDIHNFSFDEFKQQSAGLKQSGLFA